MLYKGLFGLGLVGLLSLGSESCHRNVKKTQEASFGDAAVSAVVAPKGRCFAITNKVFDKSSRPNQSTPGELKDGPGFPQLLSQTGCIDPKNPRLPGVGVVPYEINAPLWSDNADKERFFAVPEGQKIRVGVEGHLDLPIGSVVMKVFLLQGKLIETRLFMRESDGSWAGYSYEWRDDGSDAVLLTQGKEKKLGDQTWVFPSRAQCLTCHSQVAGVILGLELAQMNRNVSNSQDQNQLTMLQKKNLLDESFIVPTDEQAILVDHRDPAQPIEARARSYLHSNCSFCHRPGGNGVGSFDLRYQQDFAGTQTCNVDPIITDLGVSGAKILRPGAPTKSVIYLRMANAAEFRMPPILSRIPDPIGLKIVYDWIVVRSTCDLTKMDLKKSNL